MNQVRMTFDDLIRETQRIRFRLSDSKDRLIANNPRWDVQKDARLRSLSKLLNVLDVAVLANVFLSENLQNNDWWEAHTGGTASMSDKRHLALQFQELVTIGFVQFLNSAVESSFRIFLRALDPLACSAGTAEFKSIYECLLRSKLRGGLPADSIELLDLLRLVRNTIHNNGVYFHRDGLNRQVTYRGQTYEFRQSRLVNFVYWDFLLVIADDLSKLLVHVVSDQAIAGIPGLMEDPNTIT